MSNMSYCRFENTSRDLNDCINAIEERDDDLQIGNLSELSTSEVDGLEELLASAKELIELQSEIEEIIDCCREKNERDVI
jgi:hypothetical protein